MNNTYIVHKCLPHKMALNFLEKYLKKINMKLTFNNDYLTSTKLS